MTAVKPHDLPPPDTIIEYEDGSTGPLMFHYATEGDNLKAILDEQGFEYTSVNMADVLDDDNPIMVKYDNDDIEHALAEWQPPTIEGWKLVGKNDSEDGIIAHYVRALAAQQGERG